MLPAPLVPFNNCVSMENSRLRFLYYKAPNALLNKANKCPEQTRIPHAVVLKVLFILRNHISPSSILMSSRIKAKKTSSEGSHQITKGFPLLHSTDQGHKINKIIKALLVPVTIPTWAGRERHTSKKIVHWERNSLHDPQISLFSLSHKEASVQNSPLPTEFLIKLLK